MDTITKSEATIKATNLHHISSGPAPKEWGEPPEIKAARPKVRVELSLQKLDGLDVCLWMKRDSVYWTPASDFFLITNSK